jgi:hypothetical protein
LRFPCCKPRFYGLSRFGDVAFVLQRRVEVERQETLGAVREQKIHILGEMRPSVVGKD